jgi:hypothetical protein
MQSVLDVLAVQGLSVQKLAGTSIIYIVVDIYQIWIVPIRTGGATGELARIVSACKARFGAAFVIWRGDVSAFSVVCASIAFA